MGKRSCCPHSLSPPFCCGLGVFPLITKPGKGVLLLRPAHAAQHNPRCLACKHPPWHRVENSNSHPRFTGTNGQCLSDREEGDSPRGAPGGWGWGYLLSSFRLHEPAPQHGLDVDVAQLTVCLQDLSLHHLLQQQPAQAPVEEGAGALPLQDVLQERGRAWVCLCRKKRS